MNASGGRISVGLMAGSDLDRAAELERLPIDALWTGGHIASSNPSPEAMMSLARLSAVTHRVRLGTSILLLPLYPPAVIAKQVADLDLATGGRITLGVGIGGEYPAEFRAAQVPITERGRRLDEAIPLLRRLWTAQEISHHGRFYAMADVKIHPAPSQPGGPPIIVAGRKAPAMRRAALLGDGWMPYLYSPRRYAASVATIRQHAAEHDRDLSSFSWCSFVFVNVDPDSDRAHEQAAHTLGGTYSQDFREMLDSVAAVGTVAEVTRKLQDFIDAGAQEFIFTPAPGTGSSDDIVQRLLADVMPAVHAHADR